MIISDEQARLAAIALRDKKPSGHPERDRRAELEPELLDRVRAVLADIPETRQDRVQHARDSLKDNVARPDEVAAKLLGRILSDSLE